MAQLIWPILHCEFWRFDVTVEPPYNTIYYNMYNK